MSSINIIPDNPQNMAHTSEAAAPLSGFSKTTRITDAEAPQTKIDVNERLVVQTEADYRQTLDATEILVSVTDSDYRQVGQANETLVLRTSSASGFGFIDVQEFFVASTLSTGAATYTAEETIVLRTAFVETLYADTVETLILRTDVDNFQRIWRDVTERAVLVTTASSAFTDARHIYCISERGEVSTYSFYPMDSMAKAGERYFGVNFESAYELGGDDDNGSPIIARIRSGLDDNKINGLKRPYDLIIDGRVDTDFLVKLLVSEYDGVHEHWYLSNENNTKAPGEHYVKFGRGSMSKHLGYEIINHDGGDFEIEKLMLRYLDVIRRRGRR